MPAYFVSGTDTGIGKTFATGFLAREAAKAGKSVITQKIIQTGCEGISEDILEHRRIMECELFPEDLDFTTCPYVLKFPASPHFSCAIEGVKFDKNLVNSKSELLRKKYDEIFIEGVGGLLVPLEENYLCADYVKEFNLPLILVCSTRLGGINLALMALEAVETRGIELHSLVCNSFFSEDAEIAESTRAYLEKYLAKNFPSAKFIELKKL